MLILVTLIISLCTVGSNLLIILIKGSHVLTGLRKLSFLHALTQVPVNKGTLGIHQVKLVVQASSGLSDGCGVAQHAHSSLYFGQVSTRYHSGRLVVNANLEASGAPVHKLDAALGLDGGHGSTDIFGNHVAMVQQQQAMCLPRRGSHFTIWLAGAKQALVISAAESCSW